MRSGRNILPPSAVVDSMAGNPCDLALYLHVWYYMSIYDIVRYYIRDVGYSSGTLISRV
jgi:hypothetical protein